MATIKELGEAQRQATHLLERAKICHDGAGHAAGLASSRPLITIEEMMKPKQYSPSAQLLVGEELRKAITESLPTLYSLVASRLKAREIYLDHQGDMMLQAIEAATGHVILPVVEVAPNV